MDDRPGASASAAADSSVTTTDSEIPVGDTNDVGGGGAPPPLLGGADIAEIMNANGPIVKCVLLRCQNEQDERKQGNSHPQPACDEEDETKPPADDGKNDTTQPPPTTRNVLMDFIEEIEVDTTPSKSMVQKVLGGPVTFLGQYPEERTVLMTRIFPPSIEEIVADCGDCDGDGDSDENVNIKHILEEMSVSQLRDLCSDREIDTGKMAEKHDLVEALLKYDESLPPYNPNQLQPPLHKKRVRGDILVMRVADTEEELDEHEQDEGENVEDDNVGQEESGVDSSLPAKEDEEDKKPAAIKDLNKSDGEDNEKGEVGDDVATQRTVIEEFFQDYTKSEYVAFASRTDIEEHIVDSQGDEEGDVDEEDEEEEDEEDPAEDEGVGDLVGDEEMDEEDRNAMFNMVMNEVLRQYREEMGRGPNTQELLDMRANIARELGVEIATVEDGDWTRKAKVDTPSSGKKIAFDSKDRVKEFVPHENEHNYANNDDEDDEDDEDYEDYTEDAADEPPAKKLKTAPAPEVEEDDAEEEKEEGDSKPPAT